MIGGNAFHFGDGLEQFAFFAIGRIAPGLRGDLDEGFEAFLRRSHGVFIGADADVIGSEGAAASAGTGHALFSVLGHGEFVE